MAEPRVKYSRVRLVTSDREEEALQTGGVPFRLCRFTSDQGMPIHQNIRLISIVNDNSFIKISFVFLAVQGHRHPGGLAVHTHQACNYCDYCTYC